MTPPVAHLYAVAVWVHCPHCARTLFDRPSTPVDPTPWGEPVPCWTCRKPVLLPDYPFPRRPHVD